MSKPAIMISSLLTSFFEQSTEDTEEEAEEESSNKLFDYQEGQTIPFKISMNQKETKPEKQLTEAGLGGKTGLMKKLGIGT